MNLRIRYFSIDLQRIPFQICEQTIVIVKQRRQFALLFVWFIKLMLIFFVVNFFKTIGSSKRRATPIAFYLFVRGKNEFPIRTNEQRNIENTWRMTM